jgi:steroid delta-isomerase
MTRSIGPADAYIRFYEALSPATLGDLDRVVTPEIHFRDPFSDVVGAEKYRKLLADMFVGIPDMKFTVSHQAVDGDTCFMRWCSTGTLRGSEWIVEGMTQLRFGSDGRVREHIDFWDAGSQFYERFPLIGGLLRFIKRRVGSHD